MSRDGTAVRSREERTAHALGSHPMTTSGALSVGVGHRAATGCERDETSQRTALQRSLLGSDAAWLWFLLGYQRGVQTGHAEGYAEGLRVLDEAGAFLATLRPSIGPDAAAARARRAGMVAPRESEGLAERRRRVAESWGLPVDGAK